MSRVPSDTALAGVAPRAGVVLGAGGEAKSEAIRFLTYNVWFNLQVAPTTRMRALVAEVRQARPDVLALQELTPELLELLRQPLAKIGLEHMHVQPTADYGAPYFCALASRVPMEKKDYLDFPSSAMGRGLVVGELLLGGQKTVVGTAHLESPNPPSNWFSDARKDQMRVSLETLDEMARTRGCAALFMGDMNWNERNDGQVSLPGGWTDAWRELRPKDAGYTYDAKRNGMLLGGLKLRLDRCFVRSPDPAAPGFRPLSVDIIGTEPVASQETFMKQTKRGALELPILPSDHFGLVCSAEAVSAAAAPEVPKAAVEGKKSRPKGSGQKSITAFFSSASPSPSPSASPSPKKRARPDAQEDDNGKKPRTTADSALANHFRSTRLPSGWGCHDEGLLVFQHNEVEAGKERKIAAFDFDNCVARTELGNSAPDAWEMMFENVPDILRVLHDRGYGIVIISNENLSRFKKPEIVKKHVVKKTTRITQWCRAVGDVPILCLVAVLKDDYRKPETKAWQYTCDVWRKSKGVEPSTESSFYVGDAAGRPGDFSDSDLVFARNVGLTFHSETQFFEDMGYLNCS